jgi:hypothetical protein
VSIGYCGEKGPRSSPRSAYPEQGHSGGSEFARIERLGEQIDEAFAGQPFLPNLPPDAPANRRRFNTFLQEDKQVTKLLAHALELWMLTCGMKREDDWVPVIIEDMRLRAQRQNAPQDLVADH